VEWIFVALEDGGRRLDIPPLGYAPTIGKIHGPWRVIYVEPSDTGGFVYVARHDLPDR
jgi:hypothetical protein